MVDGYYVAYFRDADEYSHHATFETALGWLREMLYLFPPADDGSRLVNAFNGSDFIAKVTHRSKFEIRDTHADCEARGEEWDYIMVPIDTEEGE